MLGDRVCDVTVMSSLFCVEKSVEMNKLKEACAAPGLAMMSLLMSRSLGHVENRGEWANQRGSTLMWAQLGERPALEGSVMSLLMSSPLEHVKNE